MARRATVTLDLETAQAQAKLEDTQEELQQTEGAAEGAQQAFRSMSVTASRSGSDLRSMSIGASSAMTRVAGASEEASSSVRKVGQSASSSATNLGFELVGAAQDAQFGIAGLANQIPLITEQFQRLRQRTGSTSSALSTLGGTFLGPAGIVGAITLGLPLVQELASELFDAGDAADEAGASAASADKQFRGLFETTEQLASGLPNLEGAAEDVEARLNDVGDAGVANLGGLIGAGGLLESNFIAELRQIQAGRGARSSVQEIREAIQGSSEEAQLLQSALESAGIDVERLLTANLEEARQEIEQNIATLARFGRDPVPFLEDPEVAASAIQRQFRDVTNQLQSQVADGLIGEEEALNQRVEFLRKRLKQASAQFGGIAGQQSFERLQMSLEFLQGRLDELEEGQSGAADETERQEQAMNGLAVSAKQAAENMVTVRRALNSMDQMPMQRRISNFGTGFRAPTVGGTMLRQGQSQGALMLQAARDAGIIRDFRTLQGTLGNVEQESQSAFSAVQLGAQAATSATNALTQSLARGESFARGLQGTFSQLLSQVGSSLLQKAITGGSALGLAGGPLAALGIGGGLLGGILGAFDQGGVVDTPLQVVGESGPELAALPQGTRISTARETERMLSQQQTVNVVAEIRRLANGDLGIAVDEAQKRSNLYQRRNG